MVRVACAQIHVTRDTAKNCKEILKAICEAAKQNVDIVCLPESALVHFKDKVLVKKLQFRTYLEQIKLSCKKHNIHALFGSHFAQDNKVYNGAFLISDEGKLLHTYKKNRLWITEKNFTPGTKPGLVKTKFGVLGIAICWDIAHADVIKELGKKGAWIIFCPSYVQNYKRQNESYDKIPHVRAFENGAYVIVCDAFNKETVAYSQICSPDTILAELRGKPGLITADLDHRKVMGLKKRYRLTVDQ